MPGERALSRGAMLSGGAIPSEPTNRPITDVAKGLSGR